MRWFGVTRPSGDAKGHRPTVHPTAFPSNDDGCPLDGGYMVGKSVSYRVRRFGGRFWSSKCTKVGPVICGSSTSTFGSKPTCVKGGEAVWRPSHGLVTWQGGGAIRRCHMALVDMACGPMAPCYIPLPPMHVFCPFL